tara:strand:+ start:636 stop:992 length:357 start_codon:yes stop_codon:yes gene_type:complete
MIVFNVFMKSKKIRIDQTRNCFLALKNAATFNELPDITNAEVKRQVEQGRITQIKRSDGYDEMRRTKGIDPRLVREASHGPIRLAEFAVLINRAPEAHGASATLIQLAAPSDGASFSS